jgi:hypothetical protein
MAVAGTTVAIGGVAAEAPMSYADIDQAAAAAFAAPKIVHVLQTQGNMVQETPWAIENHAYEGPAAETTAEPTREECIDEALELPEIREAYMSRPGKQKQTTYIDLLYPDITNCRDSGIGRYGTFQTKLENGLHPGRKAKIVRFETSPSYSAYEEGLSGLASMPIHAGNSDNWQLYHCRRGRAVTKAWLQLENEAIDTATGDVIETERSPQSRIRNNRNHGKGC